MQGVRSTCRCSEADSETASSISAFSSRAASSSACSFESLPEAVTWCICVYVRGLRYVWHRYLYAWGRSSMHIHIYMHMRVVTWMAWGAMGRQGEVGGAGGGGASVPEPGSLPSVVRARASVVRGAGEGGAGARRVAAWRGEVAQGKGVEGCRLGASSKLLSIASK